MTDVARVPDRAGFSGPFDWNRETLNSKPRNPTKRSTRPSFLFYATEYEFVGNGNHRADPSPSEMPTSRSNSPKKRQTRLQSEENGSSQPSAGRMEPVFQALLNPFRHRKDSSKIFTDREFARGSFANLPMCVGSI